MTASWEIWKKNRSRNDEEITWVLGIREWSFQGDRPDYIPFREISVTEALRLINLKLADTSYLDELFSTENVVRETQKTTLADQSGS